MDQKVLRRITLECKRAIDALDVVTPPLYVSLFKQSAARYGIEEMPEGDGCSRIVDSQLQHLIDLDSQSARQIDHLDAASKKALSAMQSRDESKLKESIDETEALRHEIERLKESVYSDTLTKCYNRKWLDAQMLDQEGCLLHPCSLAIADLNDFKQINDTLGHIAGDKVLVYIANHLKALKVPVVRYGGDEFLLIFEEKGPEAAPLVASCRDALMKKKLKFHQQTFGISFSYGVASCEAGTPFSDLLEEADARMYEDKRSLKERIPPPFGKSRREAWR